MYKYFNSIFFYSSNILFTQILKKKYQSIKNIELKYLYIKLNITLINTIPCLPLQQPLGFHDVTHMIGPERIGDKVCK